METLQRTANRGSLSTGFDIDNSVKLEHDNNEWLYRDAPTAGNRRTFTISLWLKRAVIGHTPAGTDEYLAGQGSNARFHFAGDTLRFMFESGTTELESSRKYRDSSAWYHIVLAVDTTQGTAANRVKFYVNGEQQSWSNTKYPSLNAESDWMNTNDLYIGTKWASNSAGEGANDLGGYLAEVVLLDGTAASPTSFGEVDEDSGIWKPIDVSDLTFGSQGFYLNFSNASSSGEDFSGNNNDLLDSNLSASDQAVDTPTNNFATLGATLRDANEISYSKLSEGGTLFRVTTASIWVTAVSSIGVTKGKWYAEFVVSGARPNNWWGIASMEQLNNNSGYSASPGSHLGESGKNWSIGYYQANGKLDEQQNSGYTTTSSWGAVVSQNQVVGVALDMDNHKLYMSVNNTYQDSGNPVTGANAITFDATETVAIATTGYSLGGGNDTITIANFGGYKSGGMYSEATDENGYGAFRYAPPTGYYALCTKNLAEFG